MGGSVLRIDDLGIGYLLGVLFPVLIIGGAPRGVEHGRAASREKRVVGVHLRGIVR